MPEVIQRTNCNAYNRLRNLDCLGSPQENPKTALDDESKIPESTDTVFRIEDSKIFTISISRTFI